MGAQDTYLTKNAKHTHFKKNYRTHTLYGTDWNIIHANYKNIDDYVSPNSQHYFRIENNADLVKDIYLRIKINKDQAWSKLSLNGVGGNGVQKQY